jgi:hypothetical protein
VWVMKKLIVFFLVLYSFSQVFPQHLPLQIGNQWHYTPYLGFSYQVAIATDTVRINDIKYFRIDAYTMGSPFNTYYYDRMEGDSLYYRLYSNTESLLFNFNWTNGQIVSLPTSDSCVNLLLIQRNVSTHLGVTSDIYNTFGGYHCPGMIDTGWTLSSQGYSSFFGGIYTYDGGTLIGALIDGITYGTLHPLPVELLSFSSSVVDNDVALNWITATEMNNSGFQIERRETKNERSEEWETITFVNGNGTKTEPQTYFYKDEKLSAGKYQYRLKQIDFDGTIEYSNIVEAEILPPVKFSLEQNYPNPFNPTTKISWQSPVNSHQTLKIYDVLGNEVAILVNEYRMAGKFEAEFNASNLSSGIYYYKITVGEFVQTRKMILLK